MPEMLPEGRGRVQEWREANEEVIARNEVEAGVRNTTREGRTGTRVERGK